MRGTGGILLCSMCQDHVGGAEAQIRKRAVTRREVRAFAFTFVADVARRVESLWTVAVLQYYTRGL